MPSPPGRGVGSVCELECPAMHPPDVAHAQRPPRNAGSAAGSRRARANGHADTSPGSKRGRDRVTVDGNMP